MWQGGAGGISGFSRLAEDWSCDGIGPSRALAQLSDGAFALRGSGDVEDRFSEDCTVVRPMVLSVSGASSPQVTSRTRCRRFPVCRGARTALAKAAAETCGEKRQYRAQQMVFASRTTLAETRAMVPRPGIGGTGGHHLKRTLPGRKGVARSCHPAAAGGGARRAITRRLSKPSSCARDSRSTPSWTFGQANLPGSGTLSVSTIPAPSHSRTFNLSPASRGTPPSPGNADQSSVPSEPAAPEPPPRTVP